MLVKCEPNMKSLSVNGPSTNMLGKKSPKSHEMPRKLVHLYWGLPCAPPKSVADNLRLTLKTLSVNRP